MVGVLSTLSLSARRWLMSEQKIEPGYVVCPECHGAGGRQTIGCCGNALPTGECCGNGVPVDQPCELCGGHCFLPEPKHPQEVKK